MFNFKIDDIVGRPFDMGNEDCLSAVRRFFSINFGIEIPNFSRPKDWDADKDNLIDKLYTAAGFEKLDVEETWPPRPADLLVTTVGGSKPNHLVIYLGGNEILHHKVNMFSCKELMRPAWKRYTSYILRHPDVPQLTLDKKTLTLQEAYDQNLV